MVRRNSMRWTGILGCMGMLLGCGSLDPNNVGGECPKVEPPAAGTGTSTNTTEPQRNVDVTACAGGISQSELDQQLAMADFLATDFHEMVVCGGLANQFAYQLTHFFASVACGEPANPAGMIFSGLGLYLVGGVMQVNVKLGKDTSFGKAGDDLPFDLFDIASYGAGIVVKADISASASWSTEDGFASHIDGSYEISIDAPKPAALELWGIAASGQVTKTQAELAKAIAESLVFSVDILQESSQGVKYRIVSTPYSTADLYNGKPMDFPLTFLQATNAATSQTTSLDKWAIEFIPSAVGDLAGSISVKVDGGLFPYYILYDYPRRPTPDITISCDPPPP